VRGTPGEHIDSIGEREGLFDVMSDEERRLGKSFSSLEEPLVQLGAREGIERPKGLIEQQYLSMGEERADERDALTHPRRKLRGIEILKPGKAELCKELPRAGFGSSEVFSGDLWAKQSIFQRGAPRQEQVLLLHIGDVTAIGDGSPVQIDRSRIRADQPGEDMQERRLAAAAGADERDELPRLDFQINSVQHGQRSPVASEALADLLKFEMGRYAESVFLHQITFHDCDSQGAPLALRYHCAL